MSHHNFALGRGRLASSARRVAVAAAAAGSLVALSVTPLAVLPAQGVIAPVGNDFVVTAGDLSFILKQIKISERHAATRTPSNPCGTLVNQPGDGIPDAQQIPDRLTSYGLRTVDGSCNNLFPGRDNFAAADQVFPRLTNPVFKDAEGSPVDFFGPGTGVAPSNGGYQKKKGLVFDSQPRVISNLIVDQTSTNPAAIAAAGFPVRTQGNPGLFPCTTDPAPDGTGGVPANCVPSGQTLFIPNVTTDVGLSPPYSSMFTFFGQFFDHGVDQTVKGGGTVFVPLHDDDPLIVGKDGIAGTADDPQPGDPNFVPLDQRFMVLTRAQNQPGPDGILANVAPSTTGVTCDPVVPPAAPTPNSPAGCDETADNVQDANNTDSPWVDQSQTYTSHASHQVFLRDYDLVGGKPVANGKLLGGLVTDDALPCATSPCYNDGNATTGSIGTWAATRKQAAEKFGMLLQDRDVLNIPMLATDPYGEFTPGPNGLPQYVTTTGLVEGNLASPVPVPGNVIHFDTPFLTDIAHNADPGSVGPCTTPGSPAGCLDPDSDSTASADFAAQPAGTYDDEMLNDHFICGDGRCNENIALTTIHQVFHNEHDRLVGDITTTLNDPANSALLAAFQAANLADPTVPASATNSDISFGFGNRLFQAARFVTEMEYQHLVFEEFGRKMQPAIRPFHIYSPDINPAVQAEFAHAVYRFGHSMLNDDVARTSTKADGSKVKNNLSLLTAFLNPPEYFNNAVDPAHKVYTPQEAAGAVVMGSSDQIGNELDEFVVNTLRNNLLGLPLDLATLNMTRARDAGIPPLNGVRRQIFNQTNDGQMTPYTSWSDFGQHLKHPESLINFVAAYGQHPSITSATTLIAKRAAARAIVDPAPTDVQPGDAAEFMFSTGPWASGANGVTITGVDLVDLWVGGLAEVTNLGGGLLGSTFNYVFQKQMEDLQDGDRLYYLARTPGMNLRTQLEGNSFSEMIQRNTDGTNSLKADPFASADCKFQLGNLTSPATSADPDGIPNTGDENFLLGAGTVNNDPTTLCSENRLLLRQPNGTWQYRQFNTVDPSGINGQSVYNGTPGADRIFGGNDNDTFWGGDGADIIEGNGGDDVALGGNGNDIITDLSGADVPKGGPGNDAIDGGIGDDIPMGGSGQDFINGGANDNETFAGPGNDFIIAGQGADAVFGDGGDDWIQGGTGQDLLQGDHGAPFFDDPAEAAPGNDIFVGQNGENDYDAEGGDDVMAQNSFVDRNAGAGGFDWATHQYNTVAADDDMMINNNLGGLPIQVIVLRDRWQETEADSGGRFNDVIKGTSGVLATPRLIGGGGFTGCDAIDQAGMARISGLSDLLPPVAQWPGTAAAVAALSISGSCPLTGPVWGEGDILIGGGGSDTLEGRAGNDILDGDRELTVAITVRGTLPDGSQGELGRTDLMENAATSGNFGPGTAGMTLQQAVFAGLVDPGNLVAIREIRNTVTAPNDCGATAPVNCDTAWFSGPRSNYTLTFSPGKVVVTQTGANVVGQKASDGVDTVTNMEQLRFSDQTVQLKVPGAPTITSATAGNASATVTWTAPAPNGGQAITSYQIVATPTGAGTVVTRIGIGAALRTATISGLTNGTTYTLQVRAVNVIGEGPLSAASAPVTPSGPPAAPTAVTATRGNTTVDLTWVAPTVDGGSPITGYDVLVRTGTTVVNTINLTTPATSTTVTGLTNGTAYNFQVRAINATGTGPLSAASNTVTPATVPGAPTITSATAGNANATVTWTAPTDTGGSAITSYEIVATPTGAGTVVTRTGIGAAVRTATISGLTNGTTYTLQVRAVNAIGQGGLSAASSAVTPVTLPGAPTAVTATRGDTTVNLSWTAPISDGGSPITGYNVNVRIGTTVLRTINLTTAGTSTTVTGLTNGQAYNFQVRAVNAVGAGPLSAASNTVTPAGVPNAPQIGVASSGAAGGAVNATATWAAPTSTGGSAITGYQVFALQMAADGTTAVGSPITSAILGATARNLVFTLPAGNYRFEVVAINAVGTSAASARSNLVTAQ